MNVVMFHSIGMENSRARYAFLSFPYDHFEHFCQYLAFHKKKTGFLEEWLHRANRNSVDDTVYLTFDDGFADNWIYAYPIASKYGIKFSIFVNPEFIQTGLAARKTMLDNGFDSESNENTGYLNWPELRELQKSGLVDIQSHSMSHTWYPTGPQVIDIARPEDPFRYPWLLWNRFTGQKAAYLNTPELLPDTAFPVFENGRSLGIRKHLFSEAQLAEIDQYLQGEYRADCDLKALVGRINDFILQKRILGRMETDAEMVDRYIYELSESKRILEAGLGKRVDFLCWPGGAYNQLSVRLSKEVGYKASTLASKGDPKPLSFPDYRRIPRFGLSSLWYLQKGQPHFHKRIPILSFQSRYYGKKSLAGIGLRLIRKLKSR